jgi:NAD(P)-dependent dehydrogenase (short-subunit alcohol dehydrogenase family)
MIETRKQSKDPREQHKKAPQPKQKQQHPGSSEQMEPKPDYGEQTYKGANRLTDRVALITGGDSGIGRAVALAFAREGADVLISYLEEEEDARETERLVRDAGRKVVCLPGDICDEAHCRQMVERAFKDFGKLDILINNAAYQMTHPSIEEFSSEQFDRVFRTNVYAMFYLCKAALPRMKAGSSIINTTSIQAYDPSDMLLDYASTKSAIIGFTKALSKLASKQGVRVNAVAPGPVWTPLIPATMPAEKVKDFGKDTSFGRPAQPAELAHLYVFLASQEASYVTGEVYGATGGQTPY